MFSTELKDHAEEATAWTSAFDGLAMVGSCHALKVKHKISKANFYGPLQ